MELFTTVFLIFDAMDELDGNGRQGLLTFVQNVTKSGINVMITSRPYQRDLEDRFGTATHITIESNDTDLELFICSRLKLKTALRQHHQDQIINGLISAAHGV
jgi:hypothetical protein